jgi:hypothetical protein
MVKVLFIVIEIVIAAPVFRPDIMISITGVMNFNGAVIEILMAIGGTRMANFEIIIAIIETIMAIMNAKMTIMNAIIVIMNSMIAIMISLFQKMIS